MFLNFAILESAIKSLSERAVAVLQQVKPPPQHYTGIPNEVGSNSGCSTDATPH